MLQLCAKNLTLLAATTLSLLTLSGPLWFGREAPLALSSSPEKSQECIAADDVDDVDAIVVDDILIIDVELLRIQLAICHDSPLLTHAWRWYSRGPPLFESPLIV